MKSSEIKAEDLGINTLRAEFARKYRRDFASRVWQSSCWKAEADTEFRSSGSV